MAPCSRNRCATKLRYTPKLLPCFRELLCCVEVSAASSPPHSPHWVMGDGSGPGLFLWTQPDVAFPARVKVSCIRMSGVQWLVIQSYHHDNTFKFLSVLCTLPQ